MLAKRRPQGCWPVNQITFNTGSSRSGSYNRGRPIAAFVSRLFTGAAFGRNARMADWPGNTPF